MKFPIRNIIDTAKKKRINQIISVIIALVFIPSIYFGYQLIQKERFIENTDKYITDISNFEGNFLLKSKVDANKRTIILVYAGKNLTSAQKKSIVEKSIYFNLKNPDILIEQGLAFEDINTKNTETSKLRNELYQITNVLEEKQSQLDSISQISYTGNSLLKELRKFYPQIKTCSYAQTLEFSDTTNIPTKLKLVILNTDKKGIPRQEKEKINEWVKARLKEERVKVIYE